MSLRACPQIAAARILQRIHVSRGCGCGCKWGPYVKEVLRTWPEGDVLGEALCEGTPQIAQRPHDLATLWKLRPSPLAIRRDLWRPHPPSQCCGICGPPPKKFVYWKQRGVRGVWDSFSEWGGGVPDTPLRQPPSSALDKNPGGTFRYKPEPPPAIAIRRNLSPRN